MSEGWQLRPGTPEELPAMVEINRAQRLRYVGHSDVDVTEVREQIAADPHWDWERDQIVAEAAGELIATAILNPHAANLSVHPDRELPGLHAALLAWAERRQAEMGRPAWRAGTPATHPILPELLRRAGYELERFYATMVRGFGVSGPPEPAVIPAGYRIRPIDREGDGAALYRLDDRAFRDRPDYLPETLAEYTARHLAVSAFATGWSLVMETSGGELAGSVIGFAPAARPHGYVALLAVDPEHQRRGIARALLLEAFAAIHAAGLATAELGVASDNPGARTLYESVGMVEASRFDHYVRTPGSGTI